MIEWYSKCAVLPDITEGDLKIIGTPVDFLGINNYFSGRIKAVPGAGPLELSQEMIGENRTDMGWGINPEGLYDLLLRLHRDYSGIRIHITENGAAYRDIVNREGKVADDNRTDFIYRYLTQVHRAIQEGVDVAGYFVWTLMDNFEWAHGFTKKFGIVRVDFATQKRTIKESGYWYRDVIRNNGFETVG
jgi:beta-glucosidase